MLCVVPLVVGLSRLYGGMQGVTEVVAGGVTGEVWMTVVVVTLLRQSAGSAGSR